MRPPIVLLLLLLLLEALLVSAAPSWGPQRVLTAVQCLHPDAQQGPQCKQVSEDGPTLFPLTGGKLEIKEPMKNTFASLITEDSSNSSSIWYSYTTGKYLFPDSSAVATWWEESFISLNASQDDVFVSSLSFGKLQVNDTVLSWIDGSNGTLIFDGTYRIYLSSGETTFVEEGPEGVETVGNYSFIGNSVLDTKDPAHLNWTSGTFESLTVQNTSLSWQSKIKGELTPHNNSGTWNTTTNGTTWPSSGSSDLFKSSISSYFLKTFVRLSDVPIVSAQENNDQGDWTMHTIGAFTSYANGTITWCKQKDVAAIVNNKTHTWTVSSDGSTLVSQMALDLLRGNKINSHNLEQPNIMHSAWLEISQPPKYFTSSIHQSKDSTVLNGTIYSSGFVQFPDATGTYAEKTFWNLNETGNVSNKSSLSFGELQVEDRIHHWLVLEDQVITDISDTLLTFNSTSETTAVEEGVDGSWRESVGTWAKQVNGTVEISDSKHASWKGYTVGSANIRNTTTDWEDQENGCYALDSNTGTWEATNIGSSSPETDSLDWFKTPIGSHLKKSLFSNVPSYSIQKNRGQSNWTKHSLGEFILHETNNTVDFKKHSDISVTSDNSTRSWEVSSNGTAQNTVSPGAFILQENAENSNRNVKQQGRHIAKVSSFKNVKTSYKWSSTASGEVYSDNRNSSWSEETFYFANITDEHYGLFASITTGKSEDEDNAIDYIIVRNASVVYNSTNLHYVMTSQTVAVQGEQIWRWDLMANGSQELKGETGWHRKEDLNGTIKINNQTQDYTERKESDGDQSTGRWNATVRGAVLPTSQSLDWSQSSAGSKHFQNLVKIPLGLFEGNKADATWTSRTHGESSRSEDQTISWKARTEGSFEADSVTHKWEMASNGQYTAPQPSHELLSRVFRQVHF